MEGGERMEGIFKKVLNFPSPFLPSPYGWESINVVLYSRRSDEFSNTENTLSSGFRFQVSATYSRVWRLEALFILYLTALLTYSAIYNFIFIFIFIIVYYYYMLNYYMILKSNDNSYIVLIFNLAHLLSSISIRYITGIVRRNSTDNEEIQSGKFARACGRVKRVVGTNPAVAPAVIFLLRIVAAEQNVPRSLNGVSRCARVRCRARRETH